MNARKLAKEVRNSTKWLIDVDCGCCHWPIGNDMALALGWHDNGENWVIAYQIGKLTGLQCDFDVDFPMPHTYEGDIYDTCTTIVDDKQVPSAKDCYLIALDMNKAIRDFRKAWRKGYLLDE